MLGHSSGSTIMAHRRGLRRTRPAMRRRGHEEDGVRAVATRSPMQRCPGRPDESWPRDSAPTSASPPRLRSVLRNLADATQGDRPTRCRSRGSVELEVVRPRPEAELRRDAESGGTAYGAGPRRPGRRGRRDGHPARSNHLQTMAPTPQRPAAPSITISGERPSRRMAEAPQAQAAAKAMALIWDLLNPSVRIRSAT